MAMATDAKLMKNTKFPAEFSQKVDTKKFKVEVMKKWAGTRITELLGFEDDVVIDLCNQALDEQFPNIKSLQIQLQGFLGPKDSPKFCKELWNYCLSAQSSPQGVPKELLEAKKLELMQEKAEAEKAAKLAQERVAAATTREREIDSVRRRERDERAERGRGRGGWRGRGGRQSDPRRSPVPRGSRSPSPQRRRASPRPSTRREVDTYVPRSSIRASRGDSRRRRSMTGSESASSPSRSPPPRKRGHSDRSISRSPPRRRRHEERVAPNNGRWEGRSTHRREARDHSVSDESRSPSPRPNRNQRRNDSSSRSPPRRTRRKRSSSMSSEEDSDMGPRGGRHHGRRERRPSSSPDNHRSGRRADIVRPRRPRDEHRLSRSPDEPPRRRRRSTNPSESRSRSRSRDRRSGQRHKRRRSLPRYEPRRRRNTSSPSVSRSPEPEPKRQRRANSRSSRSSMSDIQGDGATRKDSD